MEFYKGFGLFNDLEDQALQAFNRARMLVNIVLDNSDGKGHFNTKGVALSAGYLGCIPHGERRAVVEEFQKLMEKEGFKMVGSEAKKEAAKEDAINVR